MREYPVFSTQIALMRRGEIVLGVSSAPVYGELAYAERGGGAYLNGKLHRGQPRCRHWSQRRSPPATSRRWPWEAQWTAVWAARVAVDRIRGYGDFLHYHLLAAGQNRRGDRI